MSKKEENYEYFDEKGFRYKKKKRTKRNKKTKKIDTNEESI